MEEKMDDVTPAGQGLGSPGLGLAWRQRSEDSEMDALLHKAVGTQACDRDFPRLWLDEGGL